MDGSWKVLALPLAFTALLGCGTPREEPPPAATGGAAATPAPAAPSPQIRAAFSGRDPSLRWDSSGHLHVVYVEDREGGAVLSYRRLGAEPFGPVAVSPPGVAVSAHGEAAPRLEVMPSGALVAAYPAALPGKWKNEIKVQRSADRGAIWSAPKLLHPARDGSHSYLSSTVTADGGLVFAWLDNRTGHMGLQIAASRDGESFSAGERLDPETCECCGTELLAGRNGQVWLAYRALEAGDVRDIRVLRAASGPSGELGFKNGGKLSNDHWSLQGCPHTGARLVESGDGALWATWFTGAEPGVYVASSRDGGESFTPRVPLGKPGGGVRAVAHPEIGRLPQDGRIAVLYEEIREDGGHPIVVRQLDPRTGSWSEPSLLAPQGVYPRLAASDEKTAVAFSCRSKGGTNVVIAEWAAIQGGNLDWTGCSSQAEPPGAHGH